MLTTKNRRCNLSLVWLLAGALLIAACSPPGRRAIQQGERLIQEGKYSQAVEKFLEVTSLLPSNAVAWNELGVAYHYAGRHADAEKAYQRALALNRELAEARYNLGCLRLEQNRLDAARAELTAFTLRSGNSIEGFLRLGTVQLRLRDFTGADRTFQEALRINSSNPEALNGLGIARLQRGRTSEAAQLFQSAVKQRPDYRCAVLNLAITADQHLRNRQLALEKYREYVALKPSPPNASAVMAIIRQIEQEIFPPPAPAAQTNALTQVTNYAAPVQAASNPVATKPPAGTTAVARASTPPPSRPELTRRVESPATTSKAALTSNVARPSPASMSTDVSPPPISNVQTVKLAPEPLILAADDKTPEVFPSREPLPPSSIVTTSSVPAELSPSGKPPKRGFFETINPLNLFRANKTPQRTTPLPASPPVPSTVRQTEQASVLSTSQPPAVATQVSVPRYTYRSPSKPTPGNRPLAERAFAQGVQAHEAKRLTEAIQAYRQATSLDPAYYEAHYNLGLALAEAANLPGALAAYEAALAIQPASLDARYNFALALRQANYFLDSVNEFEKILTSYPNDARAHLALGNLYAQQLRQTANARPHYQKVLELEPRHPQAGAIRYWLTSNP